MIRSRPSIFRFKLGQGGQAAPVALDRDDLGAGVEQRAGQAARAGADFIDGCAVERSRDGGDARQQLAVEDEILAERLGRLQAVAGDDVAQRLGHAAQAATAARWMAHSRGHADRRGHRPRVGAVLPAMSNAVPWSGAVRTIGRPSVMLTPSSKCSAFNGISAWSWYMHRAAS